MLHQVMSADAVYLCKFANYNHLGSLHFVKWKLGTYLLVLKCCLPFISQLDKNSRRQWIQLPRSPNNNSHRAVDKS